LGVSPPFISSLNVLKWLLGRQVKAILSAVPFDLLAKIPYNRYNRRVIGG
jgi:hypothetical protein